MFACRVFGHSFRFRADGAVLRWECRRGCGATGSKTYPSVDAAERYARGLDRVGSRDLGERAPLIGLLPLRIWRQLQRRSRSR